MLERIKKEMGSFILLYSNGHTFTIYIMYSVLEMYVQHNEYTNFIYNNILNIRKGFKNEKVKKGLDDTFLNLEICQFDDVAITEQSCPFQ